MKKFFYNGGKPCYAFEKCLAGWSGEPAVVLNSSEKSNNTFYNALKYHLRFITSDIKMKGNAAYINTSPKPKSSDVRIPGSVPFYGDVDELLEEFGKCGKRKAWVLNMSGMYPRACDLTKRINRVIDSCGWNLIAYSENGSCWIEVDV